MSVIQLKAQDFYLAGNRNKTLNITLEDNVLVFFKMQGCEGCRRFEPAFYQLVKNDKRIRYATCDISSNRRVPQLSRETNYPIQAVPWIFFYSGGYPVARFKGKKNVPSIQAFIGKALIEAQKRQRPKRSFVPQGQRGSHGGSYPQGRPHGGPPDQPGQPKYWKPEMGKSPSVKGIVKGGGNSQYSYLNDQVEEEDDDRAQVPENVTPHNKPWESGYRKMGTFD